MPATLTTATSPTASATSNDAAERALPSSHGAATRNGFWQVILILLALEAGIFLIFAPWSSSWNDLFLPGYFSPFRSILQNHYVRGGLGGLGIVNLWVGVSTALGWHRGE
jgi:hypothetical protein